MGDDNDTTPDYPASYDLSNIVSVAATGDTDRLASFSNFGASPWTSRRLEWAS